MRCQVASYVYMQQNCADIRIPRLFGFGLADGQHFTKASRLSYVRQACLWLRQMTASLLCRPIPSSYLSVQPPTIPTKLTSGYMIIEHFGPSFGKPAPSVIQKKDLSLEPEKQENLFRSLSRIILSLARIPQPRIGSFRFNNDGTISLSSRPSTCDMTILERQGAPRVIAHDKTYTSVDEYVSDMLAFHEQRFLTAPNAVFNGNDAKRQMSVMACIRSISHHYIHRERRNGPFVLRLTDLHESNMMVDEDWSITCIFDLEWLVSGPVDMLEAPAWLTWEKLDTIESDGYNTYSKQRQAFMQVFCKEEHAYGKGNMLSAMMEDSWTTNRTWFYHCPNSLNAMYPLVKKRLGPLYFPDVEHLMEGLYPVWGEGAAAIVEKKVADRQAYVAELSKLFKPD